ncbi:MAG: DsbA family oxidoreductase [Alphaproteobacteria bacterium]|nr:DsbA family oxidoreductase [Alphaproteobacteria bacterium]
MTTTIRLDIFSDVICPWCFIGKRRLEAAVGLYNSGRPDTNLITLDITWRGFLLNPAMQRSGMDRKAYINAKFGAAGASFYERIAGVGKEVGIDFDFAAITRTPDSRPALSLVLSAGGKASDVKQDLFDAYFLNGEDIGDDAVLERIARQHGLAYPAPDSALNQLEQDLAEVSRLGIQGVPFIIVEGEWAVSGAHAPETFLPLFDAAIAKINAA